MRASASEITLESQRSSGRGDSLQEWLFCGWFVVALIMQLFAHSTGIWLIGLLAQVILAIVLLLKKRIDEIY